MDVEDNSMNFYSMSNYEDTSNNKNTKLNDKEEDVISNKDPLNSTNGITDLSCALEKSCESFVTVSDAYSSSSSLYKSNFYDDYEDNDAYNINNEVNTLKHSFSRNSSSDISNDSFSDDQYETPYINKKYNNTNVKNSFNKKSYITYKDENNSNNNKIREGKSLNIENNLKNKVSMLKKKTQDISSLDKKENKTNESDDVDSERGSNDDLVNSTHMENAKNDNKKTNVSENGSNMGDWKQNNEHSDKSDQENQNSKSENSDDDLYSVISGPENYDEIFMGTPNDDYYMSDNIKLKRNILNENQNNSGHTKNIENEDDTNFNATKYTTSTNLIKRIKFSDQLESIKKKKNDGNAFRSYNNNQVEEGEDEKMIKEKKKLNNKYNVQTDYEFKKLVISTINMCHPKIKNIDENEDILFTMDKISKIVIEDNNKDAYKTDDSEIYDDCNTNNSLYDKVDDILDDRNKYIKEKRDKYFSDVKNGLKTGTNNNDDGLWIKKTSDKSGDNLNGVIGTTKNNDAINNCLKMENNKNNEEQYIKANMANSVYYLNHDMIEINENVLKLYSGLCNYVERNNCTKNIVRIVPHLNNIYDNKKLCYIKDSPSFSEIYKVIPEWKDSFELLNKKAQTDTEDMKHILKRIENIKNDLNILNKDLIDDKKEFENIKFETIQHESMISNFEKKNKTYIKGVLKLDNMSFKLKKIHKINTNNLNNFNITENVNRLLKYVDNAMTDYSQLFNEEKSIEILRFQQLDNTFNILTNTDDEYSFLMNLLKDELKEMIYEKKEQLQNIIRRTMLYKAFDTTSFKDQITNTLNKQTLLINQIKYNLQCNVLLLFDMYTNFSKKNIKIIKIPENYVKDYTNEVIKKSYIIKTFNDTKKNVSKYFNCIHFTRNRPITHPFFIHFCLGEKFLYHFINFVLYPLSEENQKKFMQYCSIPGFNSFLFVDKVLKLHKEEQQFPSTDLTYDFSSAYDRIGKTDYNNTSLINQYMQKWNELNPYLLALRNASEFCFQQNPNDINDNNDDYTSYTLMDSKKNAFDLINHIPDSIIGMSNAATAAAALASSPGICNNINPSLGFSSSFDNMNKLNNTFSLLNNQMSNNTNTMFNNITGVGTNLSGLNSGNTFASNNNLFANNSGSNLFGSTFNNSTSTTMRNNSTPFGTTNNSLLSGPNSSQSMFNTNLPKSSTSSIFCNTSTTSSFMGSGMNNTSNMSVGGSTSLFGGNNSLGNNMLNLNNRNPSENNSAGGIFGSSNYSTTANNNMLTGSTPFGTTNNNLLSGANSSPSMFNTNLPKSPTSSIFGNTSTTSSFMGSGMNNTPNMSVGGSTSLFGGTTNLGNNMLNTNNRSNNILNMSSTSTMGNQQNSLLINNSAIGNNNSGLFNKSTIGSSSIFNSSMNNNTNSQFNRTTLNTTSSSLFGNSSTSNNNNTLCSNMGMNNNTSSIFSGLNNNKTTMFSNNNMFGSNMNNNANSSGLNTGLFSLSSDTNKIGNNNNMSNSLFTNSSGMSRINTNNNNNNSLFSNVNNYGASSNKSMVNTSSFNRGINMGSNNNMSSYGLGGNTNFGSGSFMGGNTSGNNSTFSGNNNYGGLFGGNNAQKGTSSSIFSNNNTSMFSNNTRDTNIFNNSNNSASKNMFNNRMSYNSTNNITSNNSNTFGNKTGFSGSNNLNQFSTTSNNIGNTSSNNSMFLSNNNMMRNNSSFPLSNNNYMSSSNLSNNNSLFQKNTFSSTQTNRDSLSGFNTLNNNSSSNNFGNKFQQNVGNTFGNAFGNTTNNSMFSNNNSSSFGANTNTGLGANNNSMFQQSNSNFQYNFKPANNSSLFSR
ncbi:hypothetical protein YYC_02009 [Plasmodium yoelii 17X]|uniref:Nucleoporin NUP205 n=1 Tax=Plasmodium yoelii 17X TaxID=1323249 RepID=V7PNQ9_PLAYE|nr:hypothetical protein YYC_02009 [Plasmodium yoelii 17X]